MIGEKHPTEGGEVYLGDGLYASFDGWQIQLRAPRENGDHFVALEPEVLDNLITFIKSLGWKDEGRRP